MWLELCRYMDKRDEILGLLPLSENKNGDDRYLNNFFEGDMCHVILRFKS